MRGTVVVASLLSFLLSSLPAHAQAEAKFTVDGLVNCTQPAVRDYPLHIDGAGQLSTDRTATLAVSGNVENTIYNAKLGGKPIEAESGSASLRVTSRRSLRAIRDYPNNKLVIDLTVRGHKCAIKISHRLKPGKRQYTFVTSFGLAYCDKPRITSATCSAQ
ncbi:MAG TPA: hypothetical protein VKR55_18010 [Bradyrhizobium sp.]|uniref:hypothetical protein n=1 Tax=Bradyrhizobium sp. TaxID=376 RepID=UPI002BD8F2A6|nr:hypothetical protein [Bradyrhizobium sp.]HLZ04026.1 hypothetical protein [Bradyrhizobium sp.]